LRPGVSSRVLRGFHPVRDREPPRRRGARSADRRRARGDRARRQAGRRAVRRLRGRDRAAHVAGRARLRDGAALRRRAARHLHPPRSAPRAPPSLRQARGPARRAAHDAAGEVGHRRRYAVRALQADGDRGLPAHAARRRGGPRAVRDLEGGRGGAADAAPRADALMRAEAAVSGGTATPVLKAELCRAVDARRDELAAVAREIHAHPELAFEEHRAAALLTRTLREAGLAVVAPCYGLATAFECRIGASSGPSVALLAEYDALPGMGHACGHNLIATAALGAGLALAALGARLPGRVRLLGTPAEEAGCGKELLARAGAFDGVDAALMVHPAGVDLETMPSIALAEVEVVYRGVASHAAAMPERGVN